MSALGHILKVCIDRSKHGIRTLDSVSTTLPYIEAGCHVRPLLIYCLLLKADFMGFRYGTYDHLMLLLGRLANFCSKDQSRKRRASRGKFGPQGSGSPPPFPGMLPTAGKVKPPMGFTPPRDPSPQSDILEDPDPEASFQSALQEWEAIRLAFDAFETQLGPEFQPLRPEYSDRRDSPFGMTLQYRTFSVAGLWMNFYMGMIHLYRAHPKMPPAAMQAAGLSARQTAGFANQVGRVAAGLSDDCSQVTEISTLVSAAFIESCFCLFVAGIQVLNYPLFVSLSIG